MRKISLILIGLMLLVGCNIVQEKVNAKPEGNVVLISPSSLFEGDTKKLEPHLGLRTGSVKIEYNGEKKVISCTYEIWENGKLVKDNITSLHSRIDGGFNGEVSISVHINDKKNDQVQITTAISESNGYTSISGNIYDTPLYYSSVGVANINEVFEVTDSDEIIVWGLVASEDGSSNYTDIRKTIEEADWALVLKVYFQEDFSK